MAVLYSLGLPGMGHFYLGRRAVGVVELLIALGLVGAGVYDVVLAFLAVIEEEAPIWDIARTSLGWAPILIGYSILSGVFTWIVSRHVCVPRARPSSHDHQVD